MQAKKPYIKHSRSTVFYSRNHRTLLTHTTLYFRQQGDSLGVVGLQQRRTIYVVNGFVCITHLQQTTTYHKHSTDYIFNDQIAWTMWRIYVCNSLPIFTKFYTWFRDVVSSVPIICEINWN